MSKFIDYVSCFQDDYDHEEMHYIISNAVEKSIELSKEYEELYYKIIQDVQVIYVAFATEPFEEYEFDEWLRQEIYEEEEEEMEYEGKRRVVLEDPPLRVEQMFEKKECEIVYNDRESLKKGDIAVFRANQFEDTEYVKSLIKEKVKVVIVVDKDYPEQEEMFKKLKVIMISNVPAKHEQEQVMWELNL